MTREEAIKIIERARAVVLGNGEYDEAMGMAIEALKADPKDIFYDGYAYCLMDFGRDTVLCRDCNLIDTWLANCIDDVIDEQPTIEVAPRWIPCSERLPEEDASVLASIKNHSFEVAVGEIDGEVFWIVDGFIPLDDVIAWMPLPEPYKGGEQNE